LSGKNQKPIFNARAGMFTVLLKKALNRDSERIPRRLPRGGFNELRRRIMLGVATRNKHLPIDIQKTTSDFFCQLSDGCCLWMKSAENNHSYLSEEAWRQGSQVL
jgi:hypothetical protein